jgi:hypothetical protein
MSKRRNVGIKIKMITPAGVLENILYTWRYKLLKVLTTYENAMKTKVN